MQLTDFLNYLLTAAGSGAATVLVIAYLDHLKPLPPELKFWLAIALSWALPALAYGVQLLTGMTTFSLEGVFLVASIGYMVSQSVHRVSEKVH